MKIEFENDAKYVTARNDDGSVATRCNTEYTDLRDDESIDSFIARKGGPEACAAHLSDCYSKATRI